MWKTEEALARLLDPYMGDPGDIWLRNWCCCITEEMYVCGLECAHVMT